MEPSHPPFRDDELAHINALSERCAVCEHMSLFHHYDVEWNDERCLIEECPCDDFRKIREE